MTTEQQPVPQPGLSQVIADLFSPTTWAALRYFLAALSPFLSLFGLSALTPNQIDTVIGYSKEAGTLIQASMVLIGIVLPLTALVFGVLSSTIKAQASRWRALAKDPSQASADTQKAIISAVAGIAKAGTSTDVAASLVAATNSLSQVQTIVTDKAISEAVNQPGVVSAPQ